MPTATYFIVRVYRKDDASRMHGVVENMSGEQFPFHTMEDLWRVLRETDNTIGRARFDNPLAPDR